VEGYVTAMQTRGESRAAWVIALRFRGSQDALRAQIDAKAGLELQWRSSAQSDEANPAPCAQGRCPMSAHFADEHTLVLARGVWHASPSEKGSERACLELARDNPNALEVAARRAESLFADGPSNLPIETRSVARVAADSVVIERDDLMASSEAAEQMLLRDAGSDVLGGAARGIDLDASRTREDVLVHTHLRVRWDDLTLRAGDDERAEHARRYAERLTRVRPDTAVDFSSRDDVLRELAARRQLAEDSTADPAQVRADLAAFLDRALREHPDDAELRAARAALLPTPPEPPVTPPGGPAMTPP
jgi:hypothetical protein